MFILRSTILWALALMLIGAHDTLCGFAFAGPVETIATACPAYVSFARVGDALYFSAYDEISGCELHKLEGGEIALVRDAFPGPEGAYPAMFFGDSSGFYLSASSEDGRGIWRVDQAGMREILSSQASRGTLTPFMASSRGGVYVATEAEPNKLSLWRVTEEQVEEI